MVCTVGGYMRSTRALPTAAAFQLSSSRTHTQKMTSLSLPYVCVFQRTCPVPRGLSDDGGALACDIWYVTNTSLSDVFVT